MPDFDRVRAFLSELRDRWDDPYWRADHPELGALLVAVITGLVGLAFTIAQLMITRRFEDG